MLAVRQTGEAWRTDTLAVDAAHRRRALDARCAARRPAPRGERRARVERQRRRSTPPTGRSSAPSCCARPIPRTSAGRAENLPVGEPLRLPRGTSIDDQRPRVGAARLGDARRRSGRDGRAVAARPRVRRPPRRRQVRAAALARVGHRRARSPICPRRSSSRCSPDSAPHVEITAPDGRHGARRGRSASGSGLTASDDHGIAHARRCASRGSPRDGDAPASGQPVASAVGTSWVGAASVDVDRAAAAAGRRGARARRSGGRVAVGAARRESRPDHQATDGRGEPHRGARRSAIRRRRRRAPRRRRRSRSRSAPTRRRARRRATAARRAAQSAAQRGSERRRMRRSR